MPDKQLDFVSKQDLKRQLEDYHKFAFSGSMINTCLAFVLGAAFGKIIDAMVKSVVMPTFNFCVGTDWRTLSWSPVTGLKVELGTFIGASIDFFIITVVCYVVWKIARKYAAQNSP